MRQHQLTAILISTLAACSQILGVDDVTINDGDSNHDGTHYGYVIDRVFVPAVQSQAQQYALDLGSATSSTPDGFADNSLGVTLATIASQNITIQSKINSLIDRGDIIHLIDLQTSNFANASNVGLTIRTGQDPVPSACNGPGDVTCRHHLAGTGTFSVPFSSPTDSTLDSTIANNVLNGRSNAITIQINIDGDILYDIELTRARIAATSFSESNIMTATIAGLITKSDLINKIAPTIQSQLRAIVASDCFGGNPPNCSCLTNSPGANILKLFDGDTTNGTDRDCLISLEEILEYAKLDSCSKDSCAAADSISIGIKIEATKASFPF